MKTVLVAALLVLVAGCGSSSDDKSNDAATPKTTSTSSPSASASSDTSSSQKCADIWVAGKVLPKSYEMCVRSDGDYEAGVSDDCKDGTSLFVYDDKFWAFGGGKITGPVDVANTPEYQAASDACSS